MPTGNSGVRLGFIVFGLVALLSGCSGRSETAPSLDGKPLSATVDMREVQVAYLGSAGGGSGTLFFRGSAYPFTIVNLGVGGVGASTIDASGDVYGLDALSQFPGAYVQGRYGVAVGRSSAGDLWLKNDAGVVMRLRAKREGLMLSLGGDAVDIRMR